MSHSFCYVSDDEAQSWKKSLSELFVSIRRAAYDLEEPTVVELKDGRLLMHLRSQLGRMYHTYSNDGGINWSRPQPMPIASSYIPCYLCRIPSNDFLLMIWNQAARQDILTGLHRMRLSCAISKDEGKGWETFKNLELLDDTTVVPPPPADLVEVWSSGKMPVIISQATSSVIARRPVHCVSVMPMSPSSMTKQSLSMTMD